MMAMTADKQKALDLTLRSVEKQFGKGAIMRLGTTSAAEGVKVIKSGSVGLNLALGYGGMISFGHAAFFGLGGYVAGIAATHAFDGSAFLTWPFEIGGTDQMLAIWPLAMLLAGLVAAAVPGIAAAAAARTAR